MKRQSNLFVYLGTAILTLCAISFCSRPASAQVSAGLSSISGIVQDTTGAAVVGAHVMVSDEAKGVHLMLDTTSGGVFNAPALEPAGGYAVTVMKDGFSAYEAKDLLLEVGQDLNLVIRLSVEGVNQKVEVTGEAPVVDDTKTDISQVVGPDQIQDYPLNGRRADAFALLTPGVTNDGNYGLLTFRGVANGNTFLLDGNDATEQFYVENNGRTRITSQISLDAVQEFQVVSSNYSAEYGNAMGGVVNTVTRSGTNNFHGSAFGFFRNQDLMARDPYTPTSYPVLPQWRLQSGASGGGPLIKDKLFLFLSTEFMRNDFPLYDTYNSSLINQTANPVAFVPSTGAGSNSLGCGSPATPAQCAAISALLPVFFGAVPRTASQNQAFARLDWHPSDRNALSLSFNYMYFSSPNGLQQTVATTTGGNAINANGNDYGRVRNGKGTWTVFLKPNLVNTLRYGWNTDLEGDNPSSSATENPFGNVDVCVGSSGSCSSGVHLGPINYLPRVEPNETRNEVGDDLSWTHGRHIFKFGTDIATVNDFSIYVTGLNGQFNYATATAFALDYGNTNTATTCSADVVANVSVPGPGCEWKSFAQSFGNPDLTTRINDYDFYGEDQWRVTSKFTASLGLRYGYTQLPLPPACNPNYTATCAPIHSPKTNFMPRTGLAYALNDKTVIRAGYGMFYARMAGATLQDLFTTGNGVTVASSTLNETTASQFGVGPVFPKVLSAAPGNASFSTTLQFPAPNFTTPYSQQASLSVQRDLTHGYSLTVSYLWSNGIHLYSVTDLNMPPPTTSITYPIYNEIPVTNGVPTPGAMQIGTYTTPVTVKVTGSSNGRPNPNFGALDQDGNAVTSNYNALVIQIHKGFSHGLMADLSYTLSHELDDGQGYGQSTDNLYLSSNFAWLDNGNFKADYGNGEEDQPQRFVLSWSWVLPMTHRSGAFYTYVVNNWQLASITTLDGARPYGSADADVLESNPVPNFFSDFSLNGTGLSGRVPFWPINSVWQQPIYRDDIRVTKSFPFKERFRIDAALEVFNISNTWAPTSVATGNAYFENSFTINGSTIHAIYPNSSPAYGVYTGCPCTDAWPIDGTEARRLQVMGRFTW
jgi:hypothetical protein